MYKGLASEFSKPMMTQDNIFRAPSYDIVTQFLPYDHNSKIIRLLFLANKSDELREAAYRMALAELRNTLDTNLYQSVLTKIAHRQDADTFDHRAWLEKTEKLKKSRLTRLTTDLETYKRTGIHESIRMGYMDFGDYYALCNQRANALINYEKACHYASHDKHISQLKAMMLTLKLDSYLNAQLGNEASEPEMSNITLGELVSECSEAYKSELIMSNPYSRGVVQLVYALTTLMDNPNHQRLVAASEIFLQHIECQNILSQEDASLYGLLCALATHDGRAIGRTIGSHADMLNIVNDAMQSRDLFAAYVTRKYDIFIQKLEGIRNDLYFDIYFSNLKDTLIEKIRDHLLLSYLDPYSRIDLTSVSQHLGYGDTSTLENTLTRLIRDHRLSANLADHQLLLHQETAMSTEVDQFYDAHPM